MLSQPSFTLSDYEYPAGGEPGPDQFILPEHVIRCVEVIGKEAVASSLSGVFDRRQTLFGQLQFGR